MINKLDVVKLDVDNTKRHIMDYIISMLLNLKGHTQVSNHKKMVILFWFLDMTI